jgi:hypothetical protein
MSTKEDLFASVTAADKPRPGQTKTAKTQSKWDLESDELTPHSLTIRPSKLEWIRNYVYAKRRAEDPDYTQGHALDEALTLLIEQQGTQEERPDSVKKKEKKKSGRRKRII